MKYINKVVLAYLSVCFFWGSTYFAIKIGVKDIPPFFFAGIRFVVAGGLMLIFAYFKGYSITKNINNILKLSIVGLLMLLGGNGLVVYAEQWVHSSIASLLVAMVPIIIAIIESIVLRKVKLDIIGFSGLILGFVGVYFLISPNNSTELVTVSGVLLLLVASTFWSIGSIYSKTIESEGSLVSSIGIQMFAGGLGLLVTSFFFGEMSNITYSANSIYALLYLIVFGSIIGYSSYIYVLSKWPATKAGTYAYVNPVIAVILGSFIGEPVTSTMLFSMILILLGVFIVQNAKVKIKN